MDLHRKVFIAKFYTSKTHIMYSATPMISESRILGEICTVHKVATFIVILPF